MNTLPTITIDNTVLIALGCVCLCGVGIVLMTGIHLIGGFLDIFTSIISFFLHILSGGPVAWCGCLVVLVVCVGGVGLALVIGQALSNCGTPQAINLCSLFGQ
ncbi:MAG: hypothetical protein K8J31_26315 [Anaerolineae bacterium]|nr:hypothetical protein [Anaerolineae bacterium]